MIADISMKSSGQLKASKPATIFDHIANITWKKRSWSSMSELDQKSFSPYLINRWLSMNPDLIEIVDMFQQYTIGPLNKKHVYTSMVLIFLLLYSYYLSPLNSSSSGSGISNCLPQSKQ